MKFTSLENYRVAIRYIVPHFLINNIVNVHVAKQFITIKNDKNCVVIATYVFSALLASYCLFNSKLFCWLIYIVLPVASYMHIRTYVIMYIHIF